MFLLLPTKKLAELSSLPPYSEKRWLSLFSAHAVAVQCRAMCCVSPWFSQMQCALSPSHTWSRPYWTCWSEGLASTSGFLLYRGAKQRMKGGHSVSSSVSQCGPSPAATILTCRGHCSSAGGWAHRHFQPDTLELDLVSGYCAPAERTTTEGISLQLLCYDREVTLLLQLTTVPGFSARESEGWFR